MTSSSAQSNFLGVSGSSARLRPARKCATRGVGQARRSQDDLNQRPLGYEGKAGDDACRNALTRQTFASPSTLRASPLLPCSSRRALRRVSASPPVRRAHVQSLPTAPISPPSEVLAGRPPRFAATGPWPATARGVACPPHSSGRSRRGRSTSATRIFSRASSRPAAPGRSSARTLWPS